MFRWLRDVQSNVDSGSPRVAPSTNLRSAGSNPSSLTVVFRRPPPGRRERALSHKGARPAACSRNSWIPIPIVRHAYPVARDTIAMPPCPKARASPATKRRRARSLSVSRIRANRSATAASASARFFMTRQRSSAPWLSTPYFAAVSGVGAAERGRESASVRESSCTRAPSAPSTRPSTRAPTRIKAPLNATWRATARLIRTP